MIISNLLKITNGRKNVESHDPPTPEGTQQIEEVEAVVNKL